MKEKKVLRKLEKEKSIAMSLITVKWRSRVIYWRVLKWIMFWLLSRDVYRRLEQKLVVLLNPAHFRKIFIRSCSFLPEMGIKFELGWSLEWSKKLSCSLNCRRAFLHLKNYEFCLELVGLTKFQSEWISARRFRKLLKWEKLDTWIKSNFRRVFLFNRVYH